MCRPSKHPQCSVGPRQLRVRIADDAFEGREGTAVIPIIARLQRALRSDQLRDDLLELALTVLFIVLFGGLTTALASLL